MVFGKKKAAGGSKAQPHRDSPPLSSKAPTWTPPPAAKPARKREVPLELDDDDDKQNWCSWCISNEWMFRIAVFLILVWFVLFILLIANGHAPPFGLVFLFALFAVVLFMVSSEVNTYGETFKDDQEIKARVRTKTRQPFQSGIDFHTWSFTWSFSIVLNIILLLLEFFQLLGISYNESAKVLGPVVFDASALANLDVDIMAKKFGVELPSKRRMLQEGMGESMEEMAAQLRTPEMNDILFYVWCGVAIIVALITFPCAYLHYRTLSWPDAAVPPGCCSRFGHKLTIFFNLLTQALFIPTLKHLLMPMECELKEGETDDEVLGGFVWYSRTYTDRRCFKGGHKIQILASVVGMVLFFGMASFTIVSQYVEKKAAADGKVALVKLPKAELGIMQVKVFLLVAATVSTGFTWKVVSGVVLTAAMVGVQGLLQPFNVMQMNLIRFLLFCMLLWFYIITAISMKSGGGGMAGVLIGWSLMCLMMWAWYRCCGKNTAEKQSDYGKSANTYYHL